MLGLLPWPRGSSHDCPYCVPMRTLVKLAKATYICEACDSRFELSSTGELEPIIPALLGESIPSHRTCIALERGRMRFDDSVLCRTCQHHQNIIIQLLSTYEPVREDEDDSLRIAQYRKDLEKRYPLCTTCKTRVQERLKIIEYKVRCRRLSTRSKQDKAILRSKTSYSRMALIIIDVFVVQSLFTALFCLEYMELLQSFITPYAEMIVNHLLWYAAIIPPAILSITRNICDPIGWGWSLFLLLLRVALVNLIVTNTIYDRIVYPPPYALLSFACYSLLWFLYSGRNHTSKRIAKSPNQPLVATIIPRYPLPDKDDISNKFISLETALEGLGPQTPLSTKYTDLNSKSSIRPSPFFVPTLQVKPFSQTVLSPSATDLKPSKFDSIRQNGLESVLEGFRIDEKKNIRSDGGPITSGTFDQIVVTAGFVLARIAINQQLALVAILLVVSLGLRDPIWRNIGFTPRTIVNVTALSRLIWMVMLFNPDLLPDLTMLHYRMFHIEYAMDMLILLTR